MRRIAAGAIVGALALTVTGACSSAVAGHGTKAAPTAATRFPSSVPATSTPSARPANAWITVHDAVTNFAFQLPGTPHLKQEPDSREAGATVQHRTYNATGAGGAEVSVAILNTDNGSLVSDDLDGYATNLAQQFADVGAKDSAVLERRHLHVAGRPALQFRLAFTPAGTDSGRVVWLACVVYAGPALVIAQTVDFPVPGPAAQQETLARLRPVEQRLVASINLG